MQDTIVNDNFILGENTGGLSWESLKSRLLKFTDTNTDIGHVQTCLFSKDMSIFLCCSSSDVKTCKMKIDTTN